MVLQLEDFKKPFWFKKIKDTHDLAYQYMPEPDSNRLGRIYCDWIYQGFVFIEAHYIILHSVVAGVSLSKTMDLSEYEKIEPTKLTPKQK